MYSFHCLQRIYVRARCLRIPRPLPFLPNKPSLNSLLPRTLHDFPAPSCYDMLSFPSAVAHQISVTALAARGRREALTRPAVLEHFLGNEIARWCQCYRFHRISNRHLRHLDGNVGARLRGRRYHGCA
jgi:hypothetical protein